MNQKRFEVVKSLIELSCPLDVIAATICEFNWDYEGEPVELSRKHFVNALSLYMSGELSASEVEKWANLLEGREDIFFEKGSEEWIEEVMYELANPSLTVPLDIDHARTLIASASQ